MKNIILGLFSLVLTASTAFCGTLSTVLVTTNRLDIPYTGTYAANRLVKLGNYTLPWTQAGKSADIFATLPTNIPAGTYTLTLQGSAAVSVEIGSVRAEADLASQINATSNSIVASLTKNFTSAFAFGYQGVSNNTPVTFSSFIGDWETNNGTAFKIPASGVYQISVSINVDGRVSSGIYDDAIQITVSNNSSTNGLAYFHGTNSRETLSGQTTVYCTQDDLISVQSAGAFSFGFNDPTNIPSATFSIIQIQ
jgi:hypothetical protein